MRLAAQMVHAIQELCNVQAVQERQILALIQGLLYAQRLSRPVFPEPDYGVRGLAGLAPRARRNFIRLLQ